MTSDAKFAAAMAASDDLLHRMKAAAASPDPVRALISSIWAERDNTPFVATVFEAVQEMDAPLAQKRAAAGT